MLLFFQISPLAFNIFIPVSFPLVKAPLKLLEYDVKLHHCISFNVFHFLKSYPEMNCLRNKKRLHRARSGEYVFTQPLHHEQKVTQGQFLTE